MSFAAAGVAAGLYDVVIAGGVEMMSKVPINQAVLGRDPFGQTIAERFPAGLVGQRISAEIVAQRWDLDQNTGHTMRVGTRRPRDKGHVLIPGVRPVPIAWTRETNAYPHCSTSEEGQSPLGSSGTRLLATLLSQLEESGGRYGLETICEGQGMANALIIERL
ncbi:hypothetical protein [Paenarthrobacter sp. NPDC057981]|uniref:hypothetical protein n=1 Tax=Paenarthrobacter sp. NPDC057981 TaxID=3346297 RepID=UPI0036D77838